MNRKNLELCVSNGIALLDAKRPGWHHEIDLDVLDMTTCTRCVLGQLYQDFIKGTIELNIEFEEHGYGFNVFFSEDFDTLGAIWADNIRKRQAQ